MKWILALAVFAALLAAYVAWLRPVMRKTPWGEAFLDWIEPVERRLWWKSETILWSRFKVLAGSALTVLVAIDWNSVAPIIPEKYRGIAMAMPTVFMAIDGLIGERLRRDTTKPLEIVAMRTDAPDDVKHAAAVADVKTAEAVAVAVEAKAV